MSAAVQNGAWPVALERDVQPASLVRAGYFNRELVLWRGDDDVIRVWEDRCPHRSIRLSAGRNLGDSLQCIYHGWRYGKDGTVVDIPAQNHEARPDISVHSFASETTGGFVWVLEGEGAGTPDVDPVDGVLLRPLFFAAAAEVVRRRLQDAGDLQLFVTPVNDRACTVFGSAPRQKGEPELDTVRRCNRRLTEARRALEAGAKQ